MAKVNYKSDFDFVLSLTDCNGIEIGIPDYNWVAKFYTTSKDVYFEASYQDGVYKNCFADDGKIHIVCNEHGLPSGVLKCEFIAEIPNGVFPDDYERLVMAKPLDIELVRGMATCPHDIEVSLILPYIKGDKGDAFTFEDFTPEQLESLRGPKGDKGDRGLQGIQGEKGEQGIQGVQGAKGDKGDKGDKGTDGASAYDLAVSGGFTGSLEEFKHSLAEVSEKQNLIEASEDIVPIAGDKLVLSEDVKLRDLIAQWKDATTMYRGNNSTQTSIGDYNEKTGLFEYAGKITLTEEEVRLIFVEQFTGAPVSCANAYRDKWWLPAVLPLRVRASTSLADTFSSCRQLKIIVFDGYHEALSVTSLSNTFYNCRALRFIAGDPLEVSQIKNYGSGTFGVCEKLEEVWIQGLNASISFSACRMLKRECLKYLLDYAVNEVQISITVHPDVYARITGDMTNTAVTELSDAERTEWAALLPLAQAKNIMFATV